MATNKPHENGQDLNKEPANYYQTQLHPESCPKVLDASGFTEGFTALEKTEEGPQLPELKIHELGELESEASIQTSPRPDTWSQAANQRPPDRYLTPQHLEYLRDLFNKGEHYPNIPELAAKLNVLMKPVENYFRSRLEVYDKEQADLADRKIDELTAHRKLMELEFGQNRS